MRKSYLKILSLMLCAFICSSVFAQRTAYGFVLTSWETEDVGFYSFDADNPEKGTTLVGSYQPSGKPQAAAFANGNYYFLGRANGPTLALQKTNLKADAYDIIGESILGITFKDMTYDATTSTMFAIGKASTECNLYKIDLSSGVCTVVTPLATEQITLACSNEGQLYSMSSNGDLNKLNKQDGTLTKVGTVDVPFDKDFAQSMEFDHNTNTLFWSYVVDQGMEGNLGSVDLATAKVTVKSFKSNDQVIGLYIEDKPERKWYGYLAYAASLGDLTWGMASFNPDDLSNVHFIKNAGLTAGSAVYANGTYYVVTHQASLDDIQKASELVTLDPIKGDILTRTNLENTPVFWDLTYDYSTATTYGISFEPSVGHSNLWKMNNNKFEKVVDLNDEYRGLAATLSGELYAINSQGMLHKINKVTGTVQIVGFIGTLFDNTVPTSMEFDHNTESLYYNCNSKPGNHAILININAEDGSMIKADTFPDRNTFLGLYIPFERSNTVPAAVTDFTVTPEPNGELKATLKWTNPSLTAGGSTLQFITKVEISRDGDIIGTLTEEEPGTETTWTDNSPTNGFNNYVVKVFNNEGASEVVSSFLFVGKDVPGKPENVKLTVKDATKVTLTWEIPTNGLNTGWFDKENVKYDVMRLPDSVKVATGLSVLTFEETVEVMNYYSYIVTAHTSQGMGGSTTSNAQIIGTGMPIPYQCRFMTDTECGLWTLDGKGWEFDYLGLGEDYRGMIVRVTRENVHKPNDTWAYSPLLKLEKGKAYKLSFAARSQVETFFESLKVCLGKEKTVAAQTKVLIDVPQIPGLPLDYFNMENSLNHYDVTFSVSESGLYSMGFHCYSSADKKDQIQVTGIRVEETSGINHESNRQMKVYADGGKLYLEGTYTSAIVYDQLGAVVYHLSEPAQSIDTHLTNGVYFVKIMNGNNVSTHKVFFK